MKFPGKRKSQHYFPVGTPRRPTAVRPPTEDEELRGPLQRQRYIVGIDQPLVDIEVAATEELLARFDIAPGQSVVLPDEQAEALYHELKENQSIRGEFAGGAVGNTLHNFTVLTNTRAVLLGTINRNIRVGDYAFRYICNTSSLVDLTQLMPCDMPMGRALCFVLPNGERSFGISKGCMNHLTPDFIPENVLKGASLLLLTAFLLRDNETPIYNAAMRAMSLANEHKVPTVLNMGTSFLIERDPAYWQGLISKHIDVVAMNESEAEALTGESDPLLALEKTLEWCDLALLTIGPKGLYIGAHCDKSELRETGSEIYSKAIPEYNRFEYSRVMAKKSCDEPVRIYSHINPYQGGPRTIRTTNGAGDAALSALLHDLAANHYHKTLVPHSDKHKRDFLTYSSISQICKYANRVSYEILAQNSPRLMYGLPEREDSLEEAYWEM